MQCESVRLTSNYVDIKFSTESEMDKIKILPSLREDK